MRQNLLYWLSLLSNEQKFLSCSESQRLLFWLWHDWTRWTWNVEQNWCNFWGTFRVMDDRGSEACREDFEFFVWNGETERENIIVWTPNNNRKWMHQWPTRGYCTFWLQQERLQEVRLQSSMWNHRLDNLVNCHGINSWNNWKLRKFTPIIWRIWRIIPYVVVWRLFCVSGSVICHRTTTVCAFPMLLFHKQF